MSLTTMTTRRSLSAAMLLRLPRPCRRSGRRRRRRRRRSGRLSPVSCRAREMPSAQDSERGRVRAFDDVVLGLGAVRVARQAALLAQRAEVLAAGEQLVHVGLVAGVEDDAVAGRIEDPVHRNRQFDDAEVRAEVSSRLRDVARSGTPGPRQRAASSCAWDNSLRSCGLRMVSKIRQRPLLRVVDMPLTLTPRPGRCRNANAPVRRGTAGAFGWCCLR